jgi:hypothetical protein
LILNSFASSTPATDGDLVYVTFLDNGRMFAAAHDFTGRQRWVARPGPFASTHGFCTSPILYRDKVILNGDHDGDSYLVALSRADGRILWKTPRTALWPLRAHCFGPSAWASNTPRSYLPRAASIS